MVWPGPSHSGRSGVAGRTPRARGFNSVLESLQTRRDSSRNLTEDYNESDSCWGVTLTGCGIQLRFSTKAKTLRVAEDSHED